jgi:pantothenate kinase
MTPSLEPRNLYAFTKYRRGEFLLLIEIKDEVYSFMQLPDRYQLKLTKQDTLKGIKTGLLDFVEKIPEEVFEVSKANMELLEKA